MKNWKNWAAALVTIGIMGILAGCGGKQNVSSESSSAATRERQVTYAPIGEAQALLMDDPENPAGQLQDVQANVMVRIIAGNLAGSGVIYDADSDYVWIATAAHVLEQMDGTAKVIFWDGFETETAVVIKAAEQDLAFLKVPRGALAERESGQTLTETGMVDHGEGYDRARLSQEAYDAVAAGDLVIAMGSKTGVGEDAYAGILLQDYVFLEDFGAYMMIADVNVTPGMSGGGLFDAKGNLLGIICGVSEDGLVAVAPLIALMAMER